MRAILQRVTQASVHIKGQPFSSIDHGLLILLGIEHADGTEDISWLCPKIAKMRIFDDGDGKMNLSLMDTGGETLVVSQFTLHAATRKGNRPSFIRAASPDHAEPLYEAFCAALAAEIGRPVARGLFGGDMQVALTNNGPVTILIDSRTRE